MTEHTRRTALKATGASTIALVAAGCLSDDEDGDSDDDSDEFEIDPGTTITLEAHMSGWKGLEPAAIEGETNPSLVLEAGAEYEIGWEQGDGRQHNIELWDADEELVDDDYATDLTDDPAETIAFAATDEIAYYRCNPHTGMQGEIRVE